MTQIVAVLVPGTTGTSLLRLHPKIIIWPDAVVAFPHRAASLLSSGALHPGQPLQNVTNPLTHKLEAPAYAPFVDHFTGQGYTYFTQSVPLAPTTGNVLVGFGYDWRQPNKTTAAALAAKLDDIAGTYPGAQIWLIGHSMGGLVSRYLLESGMAQGARWTVQGLITLGTPHLGAPLALSVVTGEEDVTKLLDPHVLQQVVDLPLYPSGFELLPPPQSQFVADVSGAGQGIYEGVVNQLLTAAPPAGFGAPPTSFADAQAFFSGLDYTGGGSGRPPYYVVYGSGLDTVDQFVYNPAAAGPAAQLAQMAYAGNAAGDGIVPQSSATFTGGTIAGTPYQAVGVRHGLLPADAGVLAQIDAWIGGGAA